MSERLLHGPVIALLVAGCAPIELADGPDTLAGLTPQLEATRARVGGLDLAWTGWGREDARREPHVRDAEERGGRVELAGDGVTGWWATTDAGLQLGWDLDAAPPGRARAWFGVEVAGAAPYRLGPTEALFVGDDGRRWSWAGLRAWDADGRPLAADLEVSGQLVSVLVDLHGASFPVHVDPILSTSATSIVGETIGDALGTAVGGGGDLDLDGYDDVVVGAPGWSADTGRVYVYAGGPGGPSATPTRTLDGLAAGDEFGLSVTGVGDVNGDGYADVLVGAPGAGGGAGAVYLYEGSSSGLAATATTTWAGAAGEAAGTSVAGLGDVDGDGHPDVAVGGPSWSGSTGRVRVAWGAATGLDTAGATTIEGPSAGAQFGFSVAGAGDVNGDTYADLIVGAPGVVSGGGDVGAAYVFHGRSGDIGTTAATSLGAATSTELLGWAVAGAGDVDADGYDDVLVGLPGRSRAALYPGSAAGVTTTADVTLTGTSGTYFGASVAGVGDVDANGCGDVMVGAPNVVYASGRATLYQGSTSGLSSVAKTTLSTITTNALMGGVFDGPGRGVSGAGDVDGDGLDDIIVGLPGYDAGIGAAEVHLGYADEDGDGYRAGTGAEADCDDTDAAVHPGATETCNGLDDDCNGLVDDTATAPTWYADDDGDGYGDPAAGRRACDLPAGFVDNTEDCDDGDASVSPDGVETCDDRDEDCDGEIDEGVTALPAWYRDGDGDGHGAGSARYACDAAIDEVGDADDCDDGDASVSPDGVETCDDRDEDCDGEVDEDASDATGWYADGDGDGFGAGATRRDCAPAAGEVDNADDCDDTIATVSPSAPETCNGADDDCDGAVDEAAVDAPDWYTDGDGDGYGSGSARAACEGAAGEVGNAADCDDTRATVSPAGTETCNGIDDDCDAAVDEDASDAAAWYADADGDGYGSGAASYACDGAPGEVDNAEDCGPADAGIHPGAEEVCDGADQDCDGAVDEEASDAAAWHLDADGDGYGDPDAVTLACTMPDGAVDDDQDCDDADSGVHPGAYETCDGADEDCDEEVDEDPVDAGAWYTDEDGDGFGAGVARYACVADDGEVGNAEDCDDTRDTVWPGAVEVCNLLDDDCDGAVDEDAIDAGTWYADEDGDGYGQGEGRSDCGSTPGLADNAEDCDDGNVAIHPGGDELPDDGVDQDCDGDDANMKDGEEGGLAGCGCASAEGGTAGLAAWAAVAALALARRRR